MSKIARDLFQKTLVDSETISGFSVPVLLDDVEVTVYEGGTYGTTNVLATIYRASTGATQGPSTESGASGGPNPFTTGPLGLIEFWAEAGFYDIRIEDTIDPNRIADRTIQWNSVPGQVGGIPIELIEAFSQPPTGCVFQHAGTAAPGGYLLCDGSSYLRSTYPDLYDTIGTIYGAVDGLHFNVPDFRGRIPVGKGTHADVDTLGENDGIAIGSRTPKHTHNLTLTSDGSHSHTVDSHSHTVNSHTHSVSSDGGHSHTVNSHTHSLVRQTIWLDFAGNYQELVVLDSPTLSAAPGTSTAGAHTHGGATGSATPGTTSSSPGTNTVSGHSHSGSTANSNSPPFIIVNYIIKT